MFLILHNPIFDYAMGAVIMLNYMMVPQSLMGMMRMVHAFTITDMRLTSVIVDILAHATLPAWRALFRVI